MGYSSDSTASSSSSSADAHQNEGFLKSAWHKLTHQHDNLLTEEPKARPKTDEKGSEEEPKKAAGSG